MGTGHLQGLHRRRLSDERALAAFANPSERARGSRARQTFLGPTAVRQATGRALAGDRAKS